MERMCWAVSPWILCIKNATWVVSWFRRWDQRSRCGSFGFTQGRSSVNGWTTVGLCLHVTTNLWRCVNSPSLHETCLVMVHSSSWKCQVATGQCCLHWAYGQQLEIWISLETDWIPPCLWQPEIIWKISWLLHGCRPHGKPCLQVCEHFPSWTVFFIPSSCLPPWHMDWVAERWPDCGRSSHWHCEAGLLQFVVMWEELGTMFSRACIWFEIVVHCTMSLDLFPAGNVRMVKGRRWDVQWSCFNQSL